MAPIKFEENMREKLEKRTIQPNAKSWEQLSIKLDDEQNRKSNNFWWLGIAATLVIMLSVGYAFLNGRDVETTTPHSVDVKQEENPVEKNSNPLKPIDIERQFIPGEKSTKVTDIKGKKVEKSDLSKSDQISPPKNAINTELLEVTDPSTSVADNKPKSIMELGLSAEEIKVQEVVAEIIKLQNEKVAVSDKEIDSLLKSAQKELITNKMYKEEARVVSADALLQEVETELEDSFRKKVFDALKNSYETVKSAVAQRK